MPNETKEEREQRNTNAFIKQQKAELAFDNNSSEFRPSRSELVFAPQKAFVKQKFRLANEIRSSEHEEHKQPESEEEEDSSNLLRAKQQLPVEEIKERLREKLFDAAFVLVQNDQEAHKILDLIFGNPRLGIRRMEEMLEMSLEQIKSDLRELYVSNKRENNVSV